ncbi:TldD/PmbA family protein [Boseongicola aestuarii]|uniref:Peptidase PmbA n=1 Tax=Boseongicola aestuarii TaxID=1470561 RepID=A0A238IXZ0_9RHOB|nr:TldD/PmbA family protein [Boseongicola aestuarii]SMX23256.1 peptidase PmbA [Boseongicola aestuarii]
MTDLANLTDALLSAAKKAGAESADAIATHGTSVTINVLNGALEQAERAEGTDIGLRVLIGKRQACVSASDTSPDTIATMAERAVAMARLAPEDPNIGLADPSEITHTWDITALDLAEDAPEPDAAHFQNAALEAEAAALSHKGITQADSVTAGYSNTAIHLAATNGFSGGYGRTSHGLSCVAITGTGTDMERDYFGDSRSHAADMMSPAEIGHIAAQRTLERAGARKPPTGTYPVLYDERISSGLIGHLLQAANGSSIARGSSWLRDRLGEQVLPDGITLTEDPHRPRIRGSKPFDAEGLATYARNIVENGTLMGWTLDLATARKLGMKSTASAARGTGGPPNPSIGNVTMTQGPQSRDDLIRDMGTGLLVTSLIGSTINPTTGDYSRGASGFWIENGEITYPVTECTIAGNLHDMLATLIPANDARTHLSRVVPSLLVESLTIAGA